ncbi:MAG: NAD-dependent epimerase/dehydratase family protein [Methanococcaceae archaeon]
MIFVIGGKGLVGSAVIRLLNKRGISYKNIQRENKEEFYSSSCDILIYANGNAIKYKAKEDPLFDYHASVSSLAEYVHKIKFNKFVYFSTVDVYDDTSSIMATNEEHQIDEDKLSTYGFHKILAEKYVRHFCKDYLIFRLPGLAGPGLTKNPLFDYLHPNKKVMISKESYLNFIHTDIIAETIFVILNKKITNQTFNLASANSIKISDIEKISGLKSEFSDDAEKYIQQYKINVEKICRYIKMDDSEESILKYIREL